MHICKNRKAVDIGSVLAIVLVVGVILFVASIFYYAITGNSVTDLFSGTAGGSAPSGRGGGGGGFGTSDGTGIGGIALVLALPALLIFWWMKNKKNKKTESLARELKELKKPTTLRRDAVRMKIGADRTLCSECGEKIKPGDKKCPACGAKFVELQKEPKLKKCQYCGYENVPYALRCWNPNCKRDLKDATECGKCATCRADIRKGQLFCLNCYDRADKKRAEVECPKTWADALLEDIETEREKKREELEELQKKKDKESKEKREELEEDLKKIDQINADLRKGARRILEPPATKRGLASTFSRGRHLTLKKIFRSGIICTTCNAEVDPDILKKIAKAWDDEDKALEEAEKTGKKEDIDNWDKLTEAAKTALNSVKCKKCGAHVPLDYSDLAGGKGKRPRIPIPIAQLSAQNAILSQQIIFDSLKKKFKDRSHELCSEGDARGDKRIRENVKEIETTVREKYGKVTTPLEKIRILRQGVAELDKIASKQGLAGKTTPTGHKTCIRRTKDGKVCGKPVETEYGLLCKEHQRQYDKNREEREKTRDELRKKGRCTSFRYNGKTDKDEVCGKTAVKGSEFCKEHKERMDRYHTFPLPTKKEEAAKVKFKCPDCGLNVEQGWLSCPNCIAKLPDFKKEGSTRFRVGLAKRPTICANCHQMVMNNSTVLVCPDCGLEMHTTCLKKGDTCPNCGAEV